jgi:L,D-transpeptidase YbiS
MELMPAVRFVGSRKTKEMMQPSFVLFSILTIVTPLLLVVIWTLATVISVYEPLASSNELSDDAAEFQAPGPLDWGKTQSLQADLRRSRAKLASLVPRDVYVVVDVERNRLYLKREQQVLLEATCSTGSGMLLQEPTGNRRWVFDTPRGIFRVHRKAVDPVWTKPDWAFIEEGKSPPTQWSDRIDRDTLGKYALYFGDGYMIHGTLYQRYMGRSITHGCIRLGDDDLKRVYQMVPVGAPIYIF